MRNKNILYEFYLRKLFNKLKVYKILIIIKKHKIYF